MLLKMIIQSISSFVLSIKNLSIKKKDRKDKIIRYRCYQCSLPIDKGKDLYFAFDMVYCSEECRYNYLISRDDYDIYNIC